VLRRLGSVDHERRVTEISTRLFDLTRPLHGLMPADNEDAPPGRNGSRRRPEASAMKTHPRTGHGCCWRRRRFPVSENERRPPRVPDALYHKGTVPEAGCDKILERGDDHSRLRRVLALLRAADALDSRSLESPRLLFALVGTGSAPSFA